MLKSKFGKKIMASVMAAAMAVSATAVGVSSITAFAGDQLGEGTFNEGVGLPWHICESATGVMKFDIADGVYNILIEETGGVGNGGEGRWDCQFRHRGLTMKPNHTYRITYSVNPSNAGKMYVKMGDMTNDDAEYWHGNGKELKMTYQEGISQSTLVDTLKNASPTGKEIKYYEGWDNWKNITIPANTWTTVAFEFDLSEIDSVEHGSQGSAEGVAEYTFHLGGTTPQYGQSFECFPKGTIVKFDNMALIDMTDSKYDWPEEPVYEEVGIEVNQVGYYPNLNKKATLICSEESADTTAKPYQIKDSSGKVVHEGMTDVSNSSNQDSGSWTYNQIIDFSDFKTPGKGYTIECDGKTSYPFNIGDDVYDTMTTNAMNYFYQNRSGEDISANYITSGDASKLARKGGHMTDMAYVQDDWVYIMPQESNENKNALNSQYKKNGQIDVTGGWYDAGDHGKYVVNGGVSVWTLLSLYDRDVNKGDISKWEDGSGTVVIPETGNSIPDILDEVKVEIDFFKKMQRDDGMVYHKIHDFKWTGLCVAPADDELDRVVKPVTYAATLNFAAALAQYSRLIQPYNPSEATECLAAAEKAYKAAKASYKEWDGVAGGAGDTATIKSLYAPLAQNKGGGPYGDTEVKDEFYWAECELYITSGKKEYKDALLKYQNANGGKGALEVDTALYGGENNGSVGSFTWGTLSSLGTLSMSINAKSMLEKGLLTQAEVDKIQESVKQAADYFVELEDSSDWGVPYRGHDYTATVWSVGEGLKPVNLVNGYEWGSSSFMMNNAMVMGIAYDIDKEPQYINGVSTAFDYVLGRNPMEFTYVTGYGTHGLKNPHHRWWSNQLNSEYPAAPAGVLSGGPNSEMQDPMVQGKGYKAGTMAPMKCYLDNVEAWSVNECTINWNSPLVWVASFLEDEAPKVSDVETTTTKKGETTTTTTTTSKQGETTTSGGEGDALWGDVNVDDKISLSDVILLNKYIAGTYEPTAQGKINAACDQSDDEINFKDTTALMKAMLGLVKLPVK